MFVPVVIAAGKSYFPTAFFEGRAAAGGENVFKRHNGNAACTRISATVWMRIFL